MRQVEPTYRQTICRPVQLEGRGLHSGVPITLSLNPAAAGHGIRFRRTDLGNAPLLPALWHLVHDTRLATTLGQGEFRIGTIEHLMATLSAMAVDDLDIGVSGPELPAADGSAASFYQLCLRAGLMPSLDRMSRQVARHSIQVRRHIRIDLPGGGFAELNPPLPGQTNGLLMDVTVDFSGAGLQGIQAFHYYSASPEEFHAKIGMARTFAFEADLERLREAGLALGGSLDNAVVFDASGQALNPGGLRFADEPVRHKTMDAVGDLYLAGAPLHGVYRAHRPGHHSTNLLLRELFSRPGNWCFVGQEDSLDDNKCVLLAA